MKQLTYILALLLGSLGVMAQTNQPLPAGSVPLSNILYLAPDSTVWTGDEFNGLFVRIGKYNEIDSLFKLGYTKVQVDSAIAANLLNETLQAVTSRGNITTDKIIASPANNPNELATLGQFKDTLLSNGIGGAIQVGDWTPLSNAPRSGIFITGDNDTVRPPEIASTERIPFININYGSSSTQISAKSCESGCRPEGGPYYLGYRGRDASGVWSDWVAVWDKKNLNAPYSNSAQSKFMPNDISKNGIFNQWIEPIAVVDSLGNTWFSSVGSNAELYITKRTKEGTIVRKKIGSIISNLDGKDTDDHNAVAILLDNRPGATYPIILFQTDHNTTPVRMWRFTTLDMSEWDINSYTNIDATNVAYVQAHRYGDEIFLFSRVNITPVAERPWRIAYSSDNGTTWTSRVIFSAPVAGWLYMTTKTKSDGSGINMAFAGHPINSTEQGIFVMHMSFGSGQVSNPQTGVVISDIRAAIVNPSFVPIDPFASGRQVYVPAGTEITRLWDISRNPTGNCAVLYSVSPSSDTTINNFRASKYKISRFSWATGNLSQDGRVIGDCGIPIETPATSFYFAGGSLSNSATAYIAEWRVIGMDSAPYNSTADYGYSTFKKVDFLDTGSLSTYTIVGSDRKIIRPYHVNSSNQIIFGEAESYTSYSDYYCDMILFNEDEVNLKQDQ